MRMHRIEVDNDVFRYLEEKARNLKARADLFVDTTPNGLLRKELLGDKSGPLRGPVVRNSDPDLPIMPAGMPMALRQILEVVYIVRKEGHSRQEATRIVANKYRVAPPTVIDKYCRQLNLTAHAFDRLLTQRDLADLRALLNKKFGEHHAMVKKYLTD